MINKIPNSIIQKMKDAAPRYHSTDNFSSHVGFDGDNDEYSSSYKSICIYVQNGLTDQIELFVEVAKKVFSIQTNNSRQYPLMVFGFGNTSTLQHEGKYFPLGFLGSWQNDIKISKTIARISGSNLSNPAIIPNFYPKTDRRSLYSGKTKIEKEDLLIIIGKKDNVFFAEELQTFRTSILKQILFVEIESDKINYTFGKHIFEYKALTT